MDSGFQLLDSRSFSVKLGFWIPTVIGIPDSYSCIPDSKAQNSGFHKQKFPGLRNLDSLTRGRRIKSSNRLEANSSLFTNFAEDMNSGRPITNPHTGSERDSNPGRLETSPTQNPLRHAASLKQSPTFTQGTDRRGSWERGW